MNRTEAIDWLRSLRGPWLGDGFRKPVHRDELIAALEEPAPAPVQYRMLRDEDGHAYRVPEDQVQAFRDAERRICEQQRESAAWYDACEDFNVAFGPYRE